jgi:hypothetical protein
MQHSSFLDLYLRYEENKVLRIRSLDSLNFISYDRKVNSSYRKTLNNVPEQSGSGPLDASDEDDGRLAVIFEHVAVGAVDRRLS